MKIYEYGDNNKPVILLFPGTSCYWKSNFAGVLEGLLEHFCVGIVAYTGFDDTDTDDFDSMMNETERIEEYIKKHYKGAVHAMYGCSLGGSFVTHLAARGNITMNYGIIGSSDMDEASVFTAKILASLGTWLLYPYIHTGKCKWKLMQKKIDEIMQGNDPYIKSFLKILGLDRYDLSFISKESFYNQYYSDLITHFTEGTQPKQGEIHVLYAKQMGEKYLERYRKVFKNPVIHEYDLRHEELLVAYSDKWVEEIVKIAS